MQHFAVAIHIRYVNIDTIVRALDDTIDAGERYEYGKEVTFNTENEMVVILKPRVNVSSCVLLLWERNQK